MPLFSSAIAHNNSAAYIAQLQSGHVRGIGIFNSNHNAAYPAVSSSSELNSTTVLFGRNNLPSAQRSIPYLAIVDGDGVYWYDGPDTSNPEWTDSANWIEVGSTTPGSGSTGPTGPTGPTGVAGADGADGAPGADGADGADGVNGTDGATGPTGPTGPTGAAGADGIDGAPGADGADGIDGADGATGVTGPTGATGPTGVVGFIRDSNSSEVTDPEGILLQPGILAEADGNNASLKFDIDDLTAAVTTATSAAELLTESTTRIAAHIQSQGTRKFSFADFISGITVGIVNDYVDNGYGNSDSYSGGLAGDDILGDVNGDGVVGVDDLLTVLSTFGDTGDGGPTTTSIAYNVRHGLEGDDNATSAAEGLLDTVSGFGSGSKFYVPIYSNTINDTFITLEVGGTPGFNVSDSTGGGGSDDSGFVEFIEPTSGSLSDWTFSSFPADKHIPQVQRAGSQSIAVAIQGESAYSWEITFGYDVEYLDVNNNVISAPYTDGGSNQNWSFEITSVGSVANGNGNGSANGWHQTASSNAAFANAIESSLSLGSDGFDPNLIPLTESYGVKKVRIKPWIKNTGGSDVVLVIPANYRIKISYLL